MLDVDYYYENSLGKGGLKQYTPLVNSISANAVHLEAPNSTGKTFLINLLAMGLFAREIYNSSQKGSGKSTKIDPNENGCISPILINGINAMMALPTDKLRFDFTLTSKDGKTKLHAHKDIANKRIDVSESIDGGRENPLSFDTFKDKYYLVYDFPKSPLDRIPDMVSSIKSEQNTYKTRIFNLRSAVSEKYNAVLAGIQMEEKRKEYISKRDEAIDKLEEYKEELQNLDEKTLIFLEYILLGKYSKIYQELIGLVNKHYTIEKGKKTGKSRATKSNNSYEKKRSEIEEQLQVISDKVAEFVFTIKATDFYDGMEEQIAYLEDFNFLECVEKGEYVPSKLENIIRKIKHEVSSWKATDEMKEASSKKKVYDELLKVLKELKKTQGDTTNITIPGTDNKSLDQFIAVLQKSSDKEDYLGRKYSASIEVQKRINAIEQILNPDELQRNFTELNHLKKKALVYQKDLENLDEEKMGSDEKEKDLKRIEELNRVLLSYENELREYNYLDINALRDSTNIHEFQRQILKKYPEYKADLISMALESTYEKLVEEKTKLENQTIPELNNNIQRYVGKIAEYENKKNPEYFDKLECLEKLNKKISALYQKFTKYESYIDIIGNQKNADKAGCLDEGGKYYNEKLSYYFGNSFTNIVFQKEYVKPVKIDLVTRLITTDSGLEFPMERLSTGESMSMYVQTVLNRQDDKRKLIVLFDESGTMDQTSFMPVKEMIKPLVDEGKIMFALFVSMNNTKMKIDTIA